MSQLGRQVVETAIDTPSAEPDESREAVMRPNCDEFALRESEGRPGDGALANVRSARDNRGGEMQNETGVTPQTPGTVALTDILIVIFFETQLSLAPRLVVEAILPRRAQR